MTKLISPTLLAVNCWLGTRGWRFPWPRVRLNFPDNFVRETVRLVAMVLWYSRGQVCQMPVNLTMPWHRVRGKIGRQKLMND